MEQPRFANPMNAMFGGLQHSEVISVPDRMVGLIIGKGGEQISSIQTESDCKVQFAAATGCGMPDRQCTLSGTAEAILKAKELIGRIMNKGHDVQNMQNDGHVTTEMLIPGNKAGIVIGKGGETIKLLQERTGVRMVIIQESNSPTMYDKPLRITGDRISCQKAKDMVLELLAEKDMQVSVVNNEFGGNGGQRSSVEILVPRSMIGVVIGKGGDMIKKIQAESGARIQFRPDDEQGGPNRQCNLTGTAEQTRAATSMIQELIESTAQRQGLIGSQGQNWPRPVGGVRGDGSFDGRVRFGNGFGSEEMAFSVPAEKCGLVIGKGGETIREICRQSGAHVELNRDPPSANPLERVFKITGNPDQMQAAISLISEKAGIAITRDITAAGSLASLQPASIANLTSLYRPPEVAQQQQPMQQIVSQNFATVPSWGATSQYQQYTQPASIVDPGKQAVDANAAWAYYSTLATQIQAPQAPATAVQQFSYQPAAPATLTQPALQSIAGQQPTSPYQHVISRAAVTPQPSINPSTGQLDYSAAWAEYYRQQGMPQHAQAILQAAQHVTQHPQ